MSRQAAGCPPEAAITIFGPGLLGGSLALAVSERFLGVPLCVWARRETAFEGVRARGIKARLTTDAADAARGATLLILATPITAMPDLARQIAPVLEEGALVTDVGSVKGSVAAALKPILGSRFVGSHPMAGSEKAGIETARADLFQNAACILTPETESPEDAVRRLESFWQGLGCRLLHFTPEEHDRKVARISHLPHLMACVTALAALRGDTQAALCAANGFRDTTRVAGGDAGMWTGILMENRAAALDCLRDAASAMSELVEILAKPDEEALRRFLAEAKSLRDAVA